MIYAHLKKKTSCPHTGLAKEFLHVWFYQFVDTLHDFFDLWVRLTKKNVGVIKSRNPHLYKFDLHSQGKWMYRYNKEGIIIKWSWYSELLLARVLKHMAYKWKK